jgi:hypothetical protein
MTDRNNLSEQELLYRVATDLKAFGDAYIESITSRLTPHSSGGTADLVFVPSAGPHAGTVHVFEYKRSSASSLPSVVVSNAIQHSQWLQDQNPDTDIRLALGSNTVVRAPIELSPSFTTFSNINNPQELTNQIITWSGLRNNLSDDAG